MSIFDSGIDTEKFDYIYVHICTELINISKTEKCAIQSKLENRMDKWIEEWADKVGTNIKIYHNPKPFQSWEIIAITDEHIIKISIENGLIHFYMQDEDKLLAESFFSFIEDMVGKTLKKERFWGLGN